MLMLSESMLSLQSVDITSWKVRHIVNINSSFLRRSATSRSYSKDLRRSQSMHLLHYFDCICKHFFIVRNSDDPNRSPTFTMRHLNIIQSVDHQWSNQLMINTYLSTSAKALFAPSKQFFISSRNLSNVGKRSFAIAVPPWEISPSPSQWPCPNKK